jgi:pyrimidine-nucleoside phosphorylase
MSKKIAAGAQAIVLDVKLGLGAFMPDVEQARTLAERMVAIAHLAGRKAVALLSDMNQPLGHAVGNAIEVREAIQTLHGGGPPDFRAHCLTVAGYLLSAGGVVDDPDSGKKLAQKALDDGRAWEKFRRLVMAQGGDVDAVDDPDRLPNAPVISDIPAPRSGYLREINARIVGETAVLLGAGREKKGDPVDHAVGIEIYHKVGDRVEEGQPLFAVHARNEADSQAATRRLFDAHRWSDEPVKPLPLFYGVVQYQEQGSS